VFLVLLERSWRVRFNKSFISPFSELKGAEDIDFGSDFFFWLEIQTNCKKLGIETIN
jgi:hypothetical protein